MKKNKMMRVAGVLLIAALLTTSIISGTFAKYVTTDSVSDEARVAKFGVVVTASGTLFDLTYKEVAENNVPGGPNADKDPYTDLTVESSNGDKLVAPGTKNDEGGLSIRIAGKPEVDVRVVFSFEAIEDVYLGAGSDLPDMTKLGETGKFDNEEDYYPIVYTLTGSFVEAMFDELKTIDGIIYDDTETDKTYVSGSSNVMNAVFEKLNGADGKGYYVDANKNLNSVIGTLNLTWEWAFEDPAADELEDLKTKVEQAQQAYDEKIAAQEPADDEEQALTEAKEELAAAQAKVLLRDQKDTLLGDLIYDELEDTTRASGKLPADYDDYNLRVNVKFTITVTQVD